MDNETVADGMLGKVAAYLENRGLRARVFPDNVPSADKPGSIGVYDSVTGQYAQIIYGTRGRGEAFLELVYRTAQDEDPDGAHMAERVIYLLSAAAAATDLPGPQRKAIAKAERGSGAPEEKGQVQ